jgi:hypothetical protein
MEPASELCVGACAPSPPFLPLPLHQLGLGDKEARSVPTPVDAVSRKVAMVAAGAFHSVFLLSAGTYVWGPVRSCTQLPASAALMVLPRPRARPFWVGRITSYPPPFPLSPFPPSSSRSCAACTHVGLGSSLVWACTLALETKQCLR